MKKKILIPVLSVAVLAAAAGAYLILRPAETPPPEPRKKLVAEVNGKPITLEEFNREYERFRKRFHVPVTEGPATADELKMGLLNKLIETRILLQEAEVRGLTVSEEELDREINQLMEDYPKDTVNEVLERIGLKLEEWKEERKEKLLIDKLIQREVDSVIHVSEDEIRSYYDANREEFQQPLMVRARQIVVATEEEANTLRTRILRGEDFAELARLHSLSPDARDGGDLGYFAKGQMPEEFDEVVFRYRVGTISRVVQSPYGFHIFKVEDRTRPRLMKIDEVRDRIAAEIFESRQETFFKEWLDSLKKQARITVFPENLEGG